MRDREVRHIRICHLSMVIFSGGGGCYEYTMCGIVIPHGSTVHLGEFQMNAQHSFPPEKILVPTDMGPASKSALQYARFCHERFGAGVSVLHAEHIELPPYFSSAQLGDLKRELKKLSKNAKDYVIKESEAVLGFTADVSIVDRAPLDAILDQSKGNGFGLIIMGTHGHSAVERLWIGSVTERVIRQSPIPVLAVRRDPATTPMQRILCPMNPSETGKQALDYAAVISREMNAELIVLHVVEEGEAPLTCPLVDEQIQKTCRVKEISFHGNAAKTIAEAANDLKSDLLVIGAERKKSKLGEFFSSTTTAVMQLALGPLLVVPNVAG
jgi:nucleotide-binding universal stress UspA family protein